VLQETVAGFEVRCCASQRLYQARRGVLFILVCRLLLPPALQAATTFWTRHDTETAFRCFAM
jgi:hypothetical protein